jgi:steroid delta-isomerase-like uncharacterized protein
MQDPIAVMQKFIHEYQNTGNEEVADRLLPVEFVDHTPFPGFGSSREEVKRLFTLLRGALPDLRAEVETQFADGDRVATLKTFHGTHRGPLFGRPATGKQVSIRVIDIVRVSQGRILEHWNVVDITGLMAQLAE